MDDLEKLMSIVAQMQASNNYGLLKNIPSEFLKDKSEINKITSAVYKNLNSKSKSVCLYPGCEEPTIRSHSLQKSLLKSIADNTNHVLRITIKAEFKPNGTICRFIEPIGINEASTFHGYCNKHDTEIFLPIEQEILNPQNTEHHFLLLLRSVSREYYESKISYQLLADMIKELIKDLKEEDMMGPFLLSQQYLKYLELFHIEKVKESIDLQYQHRLYDNIFEYNHIKLKKRLPVFVNTFTAIQYINNGTIFRKDIAKEIPLFFSMTIIPNNSETDLYYAVIKDKKDELKPFLNIFLNEDINVLESFITDTILRNSDNFYVSPVFWNSIPVFEKERIVDFFYKTINNREYHEKNNLNLFKYIIRSKI